MTRASATRSALKARLVLATAVCGALSLFASGCTDVNGKNDPKGGGRTLAYVLSSYDYLFYQTPGAKEECPKGFTPSSREEWEAQYSTPDARKAQLSRCLAINNRGPNCENVWAAPELVKDPLPFHAVEGNKSYGANWDGNSDGRETATTCAHEDFVSPSGEQGIDNQYYRFFGCDRFVQGGQHHSVQNAKKRTIQYLTARVLLEIKGVDNAQNDKDVSVTLYRGRDPLMADASDNAVPWQSQHIDETIPAIHLHGKIVDGMLITDPTDVFWEGVLFERRQLIRGMSLRLNLKDNRAEGLRVGYFDLARLWQSYSRTAKWGGQIYGASGPSAYAAMHALADGYKDPKTGRCTALSSAMKLEFVRAYIVHNDKKASSS